jgi:hypothetical protein
MHKETFERGLEIRKDVLVENEQRPSRTIASLYGSRAVTGPIR